MFRFLFLLAVFVSFSNANYEEDQDVKDVVNESMMKINEQLTDRILYKLNKILKADISVVSSTVYKVTLLLDPTTCAKGRTQDLSRCPVNRNGRQKKIYVVISESISGDITVEVH